MLAGRPGHARWSVRRAGRPDRQRTIVPTLLALEDRLAALPGADMSNTTIGISLSRQNAIAVASITLRSLVITSM